MIHIPAYVIAILPDKTRRLFIDEALAAQCGARIIGSSPSSTIFETKVEFREALKLEARRNAIKAFMKTMRHAKDKERVTAILCLTPEAFALYLHNEGVPQSTAGTFKKLMITKGYLTLYDFLQRVNDEKLANMIGYGDTYTHILRQVIAKESIPSELIFKKRRPRKASKEKIIAFLEKPVADLGLDSTIYNRLKYFGCKNLKEYIEKRQSCKETSKNKMHSFGKKRTTELENFMEENGLPRDIDLKAYF